MYSFSIVESPLLIYISPGSLPFLPSSFCAILSTMSIRRTVRDHGRLTVVECDALSRHKPGPKPSVVDRSSPEERLIKQLGGILRKWDRIFKEDKDFLHRAIRHVG